MNWIASLKYILMSSTPESSTGMHLYVNTSSKWLGHVWETLRSYEREESENYYPNHMLDILRYNNYGGTSRGHLISSPALLASSSIGSLPPASYPPHPVSEFLSLCYLRPHKSFFHIMNRDNMNASCKEGGGKNQTGWEERLKLTGQIAILTRRLIRRRDEERKYLRLWFLAFRELLCMMRASHFPETNREEFPLVRTDH